MGDTITIPRDEYRRLVEAAQTLEDIEAYDRVMAELEAGREELVPAAFGARLIAGESPVRVYREWRGLSQAELARRSGVNRIQLIDIEAGRAVGSVETLRKLANALEVMLDDLV
jgi:DNA-binding XRE family transcriptional regulator